MPRVLRKRKEAHYEKGEAQTFYNEFFEAFGVTRRRVASFEEPVRFQLGGSGGTLEYINGRKRWILSLQRALPQELRAVPAV